MSQQKPQQLGQFWTYFLHKSSLHGLKHLIPKENSHLERFFWSTIIIASSVICIIIGLHSLDRFRYSNTVVSLERDFYYWHTAAPSTTICPLAKRLDPILLRDFVSKQKLQANESEILFNVLEDLANATYFNFDKLLVPAKILQPILFKINLRPEKYMQLIYNLTYQQNTITTSSQTHILSYQILTEYGICYTTNTYLSRKISSNYLVNGVDHSLLETSDQKSSILQISYFDKDLTYIFEGFTTPIDVFIHSAFETIQLDHNQGLTNHSTYHEYESMEIIVDQEFQSATKISQRKCRFQNESNLLHFPIYTRNLCLQECRLNLVYTDCGCIPHFYPNRLARPKKVCSYQQLKECVAPKSNYYLKLYNDTKTSKDGSSQFNCNCLQNCEDALVNKKTSSKIDHTENLLEGNGVMITMLNPPRQRFKRQIIFSYTDLLVSIGGTAGLFLGFSFMSAIECFHRIAFIILFSLKKGMKNIRNKSSNQQNLN